MKRIFGSSKPTTPAISLEDATKKVDSRVEGLDVKIKKLDAELVGYREQLKKTKPGPAQNGIRQRAMRTLKQKKMYEGQRDQMMNQAFNMDQANFASQSMQDTVITVDAMKTASVAMKQQFKKISIDEIEDLQDDMTDLLDMNNEIQEALGRSYGVPEYDETDLEDELASLGEELEFESTPSYLNASSTPDTEPFEQRAQPAMTVPAMH